jgi:predicted Zn-dependent protease
MKAVLLSLLIASAISGKQPDGDVLFDAMSDELARSVAQLKIDKHDKPYYIGYRIDDTDTLDIRASFGAFTEDQESRARMLSVDVHVGDYKLDSGNMRRRYWDEFSDFQKLSLDDDYDAIRHKLWLRTDAAYKNAVENFENKKAALQQKNLKERPDDWSKEQPCVLVQSKQQCLRDRTGWKTRVKNLSSIFKEFPEIRQSNVTLKELCDTRYFVNNEGSKSRVFEQVCVLTANGTAQAKDGIKVADSVVIAAIDEHHMPADDLLENKIRQLAKRLTLAVDAKECETYQGPVMFEGEAAAEFFDKTLAPNVVVKRPPDTQRVTEDIGQGRIGHRILPTFISVIDDPALKDASGTRFPGGSDVDGQGVPVQQVTLVEKGILKTLLSSRLPTLKVKTSNGHALSENSRPRISNLVVQSDAALDSAKMKSKLLELGKENGLDYVLIVRKLKWAPRSLSRYGISFDEDGSPSAVDRNDRIRLPSAVDCARLYLADGHEEVVREAEFAPVTMKILRDIAATGNDFQTYSQMDGDTNITTPSIILRDVEVQKSSIDVDKPPVLPRPEFQK